VLFINASMRPCQKVSSSW